MRRRQPAVTGEDLPPDIAAGPDPRLWSPERPDDQYAAKMRWHVAGRAWGLSHGMAINGWERLLSAEVRDAISCRARLDPNPRPAPWEAS